jgi:tripartite-type tricarboxylate transporter receptor subunit TctC
MNLKACLTAKLLLGAACVSLATPAAAQFTPSRPVTMTVGFAPGGGTDTAARIIAKKLTENIGQSVVVENRAGAGGNIAAQHVATAAPDGYLLHLSSVGPLTVAPAMQKNLAYDVKRDLAPITMAVVFPNLFIVHPGVPAKTLKEFVELAKAKKGQISYGSSGVGGVGHLSGELFKQAAGIDMIHVPYKGGGPAMTDLLGGRIHMYNAVPSTAKPHVEAGKVSAIATTGLKRAAIMPDVPTVAESGYPGFEAINWYAVVMSSKVPKDIQEYWNRELVKVLKDPAVSAELAKHGLEPQPGSAQELARYIDSETEKWAKVVRAGNITAE